MSFTKILDSDREGKGNVGQPDTPLLTTTEMQEQMDSLTNMAIDKFNDHIDELEAPTAAQNVGCTVPDGYTADEKMQSVIDAIALEAQQSIAARHTHSNKATLDAISATVLESITGLISMFSLVTAVETSVSGDLDKIPTSSALANYISGYNWKEVIRDAIFPVGSVYITTTIDPDTIFGTSGKWSLLKTDDGIKYYKRLS